MEDADRFAEIDEDLYVALEAVEETALAALPVVAACGIFLPPNKWKAKLNDWYVHPTLNCTGACGGTRQPIFHCSATRPTIGHALRAARLFILEEHGACIGRAEAAGQPSSSRTANAFEAMGQAAAQGKLLQAAHMRKEAARIAAKDALAERERADADYEHVHAACKRQRTGLRAAAGTASGAGEGWLTWTPGNWQQNERKAATRRGVAVTGPATEGRLPARGGEGREERGWRHHWWHRCALAQMGLY